MRRRLEPEELARALADLSGWEERGGKLTRTYRFRDFAEAFAFMTACATRIDALDHHPEWFNVYSTVRIELVTHDAGGITARDVELARIMEDTAARFTRI